MNCRIAAGIALALLVLLAGILMLGSDDAETPELDTQIDETEVDPKPRRFDAPPLEADPVEAKKPEAAPPEATKEQPRTGWRGLALLSDGTPAKKARVEIYPPLNYPKNSNGVGMAFAKEWGNLRTFSDDEGRFEILLAPDVVATIDPEVPVDPKALLSISYRPEDTQHIVRYYAQECAPVVGEVIELGRCLVGDGPTFFGRVLTQEGLRAVPDLELVISFSTGGAAPILLRTNAEGEFEASGVRTYGRTVPEYHGLLAIDLPKAFPGEIVEAYYSIPDGDPRLKWARPGPEGLYQMPVSLPVGGAQVDIRVFCTAPPRSTKAIITYTGTAKNLNGIVVLQDGLMKEASRFSLPIYEGAELEFPLLIPIEELKAGGTQVELVSGGEFMRIPVIATQATEKAEELRVASGAWKQGAEMRGQVFQDGKALRGAFVKLRLSAEERSFNGNGYRDARCDSEGAFLLQCVPPRSDFYLHLYDARGQPLGFRKIRSNTTLTELGRIEF